LSKTALRHLQHQQQQPERKQQAGKILATVLSSSSSTTQYASNCLIGANSMLVLYADQLQM
jgi:hypothetical protein